MSNNSCQVDFYVLQDASRSVEQLACHLALMAWEQGMRSLVVAPSAEQADQLDKLMWSVPAGRFLPHRLASQGSSRSSADAPVTIGTMADLDTAAADVIINLENRAVPEPGRFRRLLELVPAGDAERKASRLKFRAYREIGLQPVSHEMGKN